jgi:hypothetical protein
MNSRSIRTGMCLHVLALIVLAPTLSALAQKPGAAVVTPVDTFSVIVPLRATEEITKDIGTVQSERTRSKAQLYEAKEKVVKLEKQIEVKENEVKLLESRIEVADKEKRPEEVKNLKEQIAGAEKITDLLEKQKDMYAAEVEAAEAAIESYQSAEEMYDQETALTKKRLERADAEKSGMDSVARAASNKIIREFEDGYLESQVQKLKKQERSASLERDFVELKIKVAEAQAKVRETK